LKENNSHQKAPLTIIDRLKFIDGKEALYERSGL
jgi:hypothetical protein